MRIAVRKRLRKAVAFSCQAIRLFLIASAREKYILLAR
jgi:hypothetical protein